MGQLASVRAFYERQQDPGPTRRGRVVEGQLGGPCNIGHLTGQTLGTPERFVIDRHALDHRTHRHPLGELITPRRHRRLEIDAAGENRRDRHNHPPCADRVVVACDDNRRGAIRLLRNLTYRCGQDDGISELMCHTVGDQLGPADHTLLLSTVLDIEQTVEKPTGVAVEQEVEK